jgi:hypothetical protein
VERLLRSKQPATVMFLDGNTPPKLNPTQLLLSPPLLDLLASALPHVTDRVTPSSQIRSVHRFILGGGGRSPVGGGDGVGEESDDVGGAEGGVVADDDGLC